MTVIPFTPQKPQPIDACPSMTLMEVPAPRIDGPKPQIVRPVTDETTEQLLDELLPVLVPEPPGNWAEILWPYEDAIPDLHERIGPFLEELRQNAVDFFSAGMVVAKRYQLEALLGTGASAVVWRARDRVLERPVALKVFRTHLLGHHLISALDEARTTSGLAHPHIVRIFDAQSGSDRSWAYIALELGTPLSSLRSQSVREAVRTVVDAGRGIARAHQAGVFHRDVKPANLVVSEETRQVQVVDFGFHHITADSALPADGDGSTLVPQGARFRLGTPGFMAPEQASGEDLHWSTEDVVGRDYLRRLDVYGLGATLYALLAGHPPHLGPDLMEVLEAARRNEVARLEKREDLDGAVDARLRRILGRAMASRPEDRYEGVDDFSDDLECWLADQPSTLDGLLWRGRLFGRRNRAALTTGMLVAVVLGTLGGGLLMMNERANQLEAEIAATEIVRDAMLWQGALSRAHLRTAIQEKGRVESTLEERSKANNRLSQDLSASKIRERSLLGNVNKLNAEHSALQTEHTEMGEALTTHVAMLADAQTSLKETQEHLETRKVSLNRALVTVASQEEDIVRLHGQLEQAASRLSRTERELEQIGQERERLRADKTRLEDRSAAYREELLARERQTRQLAAEVAAAEEMIVHLRRQLNEKISRLAALEGFQPG